MKTSDILLINIKKLKTRTKKAMFLIVPIVVLITLSIVISSQIENIKSAAANSVFGTISQKFTLIEIQTPQQDFNPSSFFNGSNSVEDNRFSNLDEQVIQTISGVSSVSLQTELPVKNVKTTDLFDGKTVSLSSLSTLDSNSAALYTTDGFTYTQGEPIPIILNASSFVNSYEDWNGQDEITLDTSNIQRGEGGGPAERLSFLKTEAIDYNKDDLIGQEFTIQIGGLDSIQDYTMDRSSGTMVIKKLSDSDLQAKVDERKTAISAYWDYDKISQPITYTFKVVGVIEDDSIRTTYIPANFADTLMSDYISHEVDSRIAEIPADVLNSDFVGITYDGSELSLSTNGFGGQIGRRFEQATGSSTGIQRPEGESPSGNFSFGTSGYFIPGLVVQTDSDNNVTGAVDDTSVYTNSTKYGDYLDVVINNVVDRSNVVKALNDAGYAYQDLSDLDVFDKLQSTLNTVSKTFLVSFIVLVAAIVAFTMSKFVSESIKEIGIFRAIGMRKNSVLVMFITQSVLYVLIGYTIGLILGIGFNFAASVFVSKWFDGFLHDTIAQTFSVVNSVDSSVFLSINWTSIGIYTVLLLVISFIISTIVSLSASRVSPVEAIKSE